METKQAETEVLNSAVGAAQEMSNETPTYRVLGFPRPTIGQLEELLEERRNPDRRVTPCIRFGSDERRKGKRRQSD